MIDFLGKELSIDDYVVVAKTHGRNAGADLGIAKVIGFTDKYITVQIDNREYYNRISPNKVVFVNQQLGNAKFNRPFDLEG